MILLQVSFTPNDTVRGYIGIVAEGTYQNAWVMRDFAPTIGRMPSRAGVLTLARRIGWI